MEAPRVFPGSKKPALTLQGMVWECLDYRSEREDGDYDYTNEIFVTCHNLQSEVVVLRVRDWPIVGYFQLPTSAPRFDGSDYVSLSWDEARLRAFLRRFLATSKNTSNSGKTFSTPQPAEAGLVWKKPIYGYRGDTRFPFLKVKFETRSNLRSFAEALTNEPVSFSGCLFTFEQVESSIPVVWRLLEKIGLRYTQWFQVAAYDVPNEPVSEVAEFSCSWRNIKPLPPGETAEYHTHPLALFFDIETFSSNERSMPEPSRITDEITMISAVYYRDGDPIEKAIIIDYVNGDCYPAPGSTVKRYPSENSMLKGFYGDLRRFDPSLVLGYNILRYDFDYLNSRHKRLCIPWPYLGRFPGLKRNQAAQWKNSSWESRSGGKHVCRYMEMDGRVVIDMMLHAKQNIVPKLATWTLKEVASAVVGETKREENHVESFRDRVFFNQAHDDLLELTGEDFRRLRSSADAVYQAEIPSGVPDGIKSEALLRLAPKTEAAFCDAVYAAVAPELREKATLIAQRYHQAKLLITKEVEYNIVDSLLVAKIFAAMLVWPTRVQFSYIIGVSMTELQTKGQQLKCIAQIFLEAHRDGFLITTRKNKAMPFEGGLVQEPKVGIGKDLLVFDFSGMYPSIITSHNTCTTTLVVTDHPVPPELATERRFVEAENDDDDAEDEKLEGKSRAYREAVLRERKNRRPTKKSKKAIAEAAARAKPRGEIVVRFVKSSVFEGLLPRTARGLVEKRAAVKALLAKCKKGTLAYTLYDAQQNAIKVIANSLFGFTGAKEGRLPCPEVAMMITAIGREMITGVRRYVEVNYGGTTWYGDTDSVMVWIPGIDASNIKIRGPEVAAEITRSLFGDFPAIKLEYEKGFSIMIVFKKKKYAAVLSGTELTPANIFVRGIVLARRDNCPWEQKHYRALLYHVLRGGEVRAALRIIFEHARRLFGGPNRVAIEELVIIREYGGPYKGNYFLGTFANKLQSRGKQITAGDRLEYLFSITPEEEKGAAAKAGEKMELLEDYQQAAADGCPMPVDYLHYLKIAQTSVDQLFGIAYSGNVEALGSLSIKNGRRERNFMSPVKAILLELQSMGTWATPEEIFCRLQELEEWVLDGLGPPNEKP